MKPLPLSLVIACALLGVLGRGLTVEPAAGTASESRGTLPAELPADTSKFESLTIEEVKRLVETFPGVSVSASGIGWASGWGNGLPLSGLRKLDADVAEVLAGYRTDALLLNGLTTIDAATGKALAEFKGDLVLSGLSTLDVETAEALSRFKGKGLYLDGLATIDADAAKTFAEFTGELRLTPRLVAHLLASQPFGKATALMHAALLRGDLCKVTTIDSDTAKALAEFKGQGLRLAGLTTLDTDTAKALAEFEGKWLNLDGLTTLDKDAAKALAGFKGWVSLEGLTALDTDTAKSLAEFKGSALLLDGLTALDTDTANALAEIKGKLALRGLQSTSFGAVRALRNHPDASMPNHWYLLRHFIAALFGTVVFFVLATLLVGHSLKSSVLVKKPGGEQRNAADSR